jgi:putative protease
MNKVELLAPAGNLEKLKFAIKYGADAVYLGGTEFGLRAFAGNFTVKEMQEAVEFAHSNGAKIYVTVNIIAHNEDLESLEEYLLQLERLDIDALIIADPGIVRIAKNTVPNMEIHLSTQASNTNWSAAKFWYDFGVKRIILARELTLDEISEMVQKVPEIDFEAFVHGAMCVSYSGRCLLSNYLAGRDANRGQCAQPCRWEYDLIEKNRPNQKFTMEQDHKGTYVFNSKDMNTIEILPKIIETGVKSLKIEGRMKSLHYVSTVTKIYREAIDSYYEDPNSYKPKQEWLDELNKPSHRPFFPGFYLEKPSDSRSSQHVETSKYYRDYDFIGIVNEYDGEKQLALVEQRNLFELNEEIEIMNISGDTFQSTIKRIIDNETGEDIERAPHAQQLVWINVNKPVQNGAILRRKVNE